MNTKFRKQAVFFLLFLPFLISLPNSAEALVKFRRPISTTLSPVYSAFLDHNSATGATLGYGCTVGIPYDKHEGNDFRATTGSTIYAGANGGLFSRNDGCATTGSSGCGSGYGNYARIDHEGAADGVSGMVSIYAHMKQGTVIGFASVLCGAQIGQTGNSGTSDGPHLHFELRPNGNGSSARLDPFAGSCSQTTSYWTSVNSSGVPGTACQ